MKTDPLKLCRLLIFCSCVSLLGACSALRSDKDPEVEYTAADPGRPLEVPPDLVRPENDPQFEIPAEAEAAASRVIERSTLLPRPPGVEVVRAGAQTWVELPQDPSQLWAQLQNFWVDHDFELERDEPLLGLQETVWSERRPIVPKTGLAWLLGKLFSDEYSGSLMDKYRIRIEPKPGAAGVTGSRLFLTHWGLVERAVPTAIRDEAVDTYWTWGGSDPALEAELTNRLLVYLGVKAQVAAGLMDAAQAERLTQSAYLDQNEAGQWSLVVNQTFDLTWARIGDALEAVGLAVESSDRDAAVYNTGYIGPRLSSDTGDSAARAATSPDQEQPGVLGRLFSTDDVEMQVRVDLVREPGRVRVRLSALGEANAVKTDMIQAFYQRLLAQF